MMRLFYTWAALFALILILPLPGHGQQLDTLYVDHFDDNRHGWPEYSGAEGSTHFENGEMRVTLRKRKGTYKVLHERGAAVPVDTFHFQLRIHAEMWRAGGLAFNVSRNRKDKIRSYTAILSDKKGFFAYTYYFDSNKFVYHWRVKRNDLFLQPLNIELSMGHGQYYFRVNGELIKTFSVGKYDLYDEWGFVTKGYAQYSVDELVVRGR